MSNPYAISRKLAPQSATTTDVNANGFKPPERCTLHKLRCRLAAAGGSHQHLTTEIAPLLSYRLRIATLITLAAFAIYLVRNFLAQGEEHGPSALGLAI